MTAFSNYLENEILDHVLNNAAFTSPATVYAALFTDTATAGELEAGTLTNEVTGGSYARQSISFGTAASGQASNDAAVTFTSMPATSVEWVAIMDASTAGNVLFYGTLASIKNLNSGDNFTLNIGDVDITLD